MGKLYIRLHKSPYYWIYIITLLQLYLRYFFADINSLVPIDQWLITNHVITILVNNAFLLFVLKKVGIFKKMADPIILRIGEEKFETSLLKISLIELLLYILATYGVLTILNLGSLTIIRQYSLYMVLTVVLFLVYEFMLNYIIINKKKTIFACLPFILNILFHYMIVPLIFFQN